MNINNNNNNSDRDEYDEYGNRYLLDQDEVKIIEANKQNQNLDDFNFLERICLFFSPSKKTVGKKNIVNLVEEVLEVPTKNNNNSWKGYSRTELGQWHNNIEVSQDVKKIKEDKSVCRNCHKSLGRWILFQNYNLFKQQKSKKKSQAKFVPSPWSPVLMDNDHFPKKIQKYYTITCNNQTKDVPFFSEKQRSNATWRSALSFESFIFIVDTTHFTCRQCTSSSKECSHSSHPSREKGEEIQKKIALSKGNLPQPVSGLRGGTDQLLPIPPPPLQTTGFGNSVEKYLENLKQRKITVSRSRTNSTLLNVRHLRNELLTEINLLNQCSKNLDIWEKALEKFIDENPIDEEKELYNQLIKASKVEKEEKSGEEKLKELLNLLA